MKKNKLSVIFTVLVLALCAVPLVCMAFAPTKTSTENRRLAAFPAITENGKLNVDFLSGLGAYFEDHFAFKNAAVAVDGQIQSLFGVSAVDTVVKGTDGWLYYTASANDFQGLGVMSGQEAKNAAHNISLMQKYVTDRGAAFVFTVAPNKNSLYSENMPYYYARTGLENNMAKLEPLFKENAAYADLFGVFRETDETLYLKRDSHWNNKGALLAANVLLDAAKKEHDAFATVPALRKKDAVGDLGRMAYSVLAAPEWNYSYELPGAFTYTDTDDVEAAFVATENKAAKGSLLMFRDSFANTLIPVIAESYGKAAFSKALPYPLERLFESEKPDTVIAEKVERNLKDFSRTPPIMRAPGKDLTGKKTEPAETGSTVRIERSLDDSNYWCVSGEIKDVEAFDAVYVQVGEATCEAFTVSTDETDNGFLLYLRAEDVPQATVPVSVIADCGGTLKTVCETEIDCTGGLDA